MAYPDMDELRALLEDAAELVKVQRVVAKSSRRPALVPKSLSSTRAG